MSRLVLFFIYTNPETTGPASLGFTGDGIRAIPFEADATFIVEPTDDLSGTIDRDAVSSATFNYGELSLGLDDLAGFELRFDASGGIDTFDCLFRSGNTLSSTNITVASSAAESVIRGNDRDTGENFEYRYRDSEQSVSRVPELSSKAL